METVYSKKLEGNAGLQYMVAPKKRVLASRTYAAGSLVLLPQTCNLVIQPPEKANAALGRGAVRTSVLLPDGREVWAYPQMSLPGTKENDTEKEEEQKGKAFCALFWALRQVHERDLEKGQVLLEEWEVTVSSHGNVLHSEYGMNEDTQPEEDGTPGAGRIDVVRVPILTNLRDVQAGDELVRKKMVAEVEKPPKPLKMKASDVNGQPKKKKAKTVEVGNE